MHFRKIRLGTAFGGGSERGQDKETLLKDDRVPLNR